MALDQSHIVAIVINGTLVLLIATAFIFMLLSCIGHRRRRPEGERAEDPSKATSFKAEVDEAYPTHHFEGASEPCAICLEALEERQVVRQLSCKHSFHCQCIDQWIAKPETAICPMCREKMLLTSTDGQTIVWL